MVLAQVGRKRAPRRTGDAPRVPQDLGVIDQRIGHVHEREVFPELRDLKELERAEGRGVSVAALRVSRRWRPNQLRRGQPRGAHAPTHVRNRACAGSRQYARYSR